MNRIGEIIKEQGRSNRFVARSLKVSEQTVSNWVQNRTQPDLIQGWKISRILNVSMESLIEDSKKSPSP